MSDNTGGLSGMAGYALGRMSAENDRNLMDAVAALQRRRQRQQVVSVEDYNSLADENARLRRDIAHIREAYRKLEAIYDNLDAWADSASATMGKHGLLRS